MSDAEDDAEIVQAFLEESRDNLDRLDRDLVELESRPGDAELLARVYRTIHTIKGTCGFLGYHRLEALTHAGENLLEALRSGALTLDAAATSLLLALVDAIRVVLVRIDGTGQEGEDPHIALIARLAASVDGQAVLAGRTEAGLNGGDLQLSHPSTGEARTAVQEEGGAPALSTDSGEEVGAAPVGPPSVGTGRATGRPSAPTDSSVRVDVAILDKLMDLVGELVLTRNRIAALVPDDDGPLALPFRALCFVTADLQETVMRARLQAMGAVTGKFHRIARDLAASLGKRVQVDVEGEDVGVDKAVNEALKDPLLHLVRNAIDHGLESPAERAAAGKSPEGRLEIHTFHEGGLVHLEVTDDGRGIDPQGLKASAVRAGFITAEAAAALEPGRALELMFRAGVSTSDQVSTISGRGVGLDVVRAQLDLIGGTVEVSSRIGLGTRFRINVPLTLAILTAVMVRTAGQWYVVPQVHVQEVVHLSDDAKASMDDIHGARILRRRDRLIPLVALAEQLGEAPTVDRGSVDGLDVVIVDIDGRRFGMVVDAVGESVEAVVKPLTRATRLIPVFAGVTVLGDGRPSLILDLGGLAVAAGLPPASREEPGDLSSDASAGPFDPSDSGDPDPDPGESGLLLATLAGRGRLAVPLASVVRLEQFDGERVEHLGVGEVIQYAGAALPLLRLVDDGPVGARARPFPGSRPYELQTIVCRSSVGPVGLVVDRIEDVVAAPVALSPSVSRPGEHRCVAATLVIDDRITELVDVEALVADAGLGPGGSR